MTLQEILKAKGLDDATIESVLGEMKQNKIFTTEHENMDIRYPKLKTDHENLTAQHGESTKLIEQMKKDAQGNESLQGKITTYESTIMNLQTQLKQTQLDAAIKVALLAAKASDVDYMTFKLKEKGELALDENGKIKGWMTSGTRLRRVVKFQIAFIPHTTILSATSCARSMGTVRMPILTS